MEDAIGVNLGARLSGLGMTVGRALEPVLRLLRPDLRDELARRRRATADLVAWGRERAPGPLIWLHGASAGELLGAAPVIDALRARRELRLLVTHFSPSGRAALEHLEPDYAGYPPLDRPAECTAALAAVRPDLLVFAKLDVWPGLAAAAARTAVPLALVNGIVRPRSGRLRPLSRRLLRDAYAALDAVGAASETDAERLVALGAQREVIAVTGDAAFDLALMRADRARGPDGWLARFEARLPPRPPAGVRLIAGSTWGADERALLDALGTLPPSREGRFAWQVVVAPHRPTEAHVRDLIGACRERREPVERWSRLSGPAALPAHGVVVFDELGRLAELYTAGDAAYVGGGIAGTGLHNVLEPAAAGIPVVFGDRHDRTDAHALVDAGGATACRPGRLGQALAELSAEAARRPLGAAARACIEAGAGAARRSADLIERIWPRNG